MKKLIITALGILLIAAACNKPSNQPQNNEQNNSQKTEVKTYTSQSLGVRFDYLASEGDPILEEGNTIYVAGKSGQFVTEFTKQATQTLKEAIEQQLLPSLAAKCPVIASNYKYGSNTNVETAEISLGFEMTGLDDPRIANSPCPAAYRQTNGIRYFLMDKNYPNKFFYFDIGQYGISAEAGKSGAQGKVWQDTFEVIK